LLFSDVDSRPFATCRRPSGLEMLERSEEEQRWLREFHTVREIGHTVLGVIVVTSALIPLLAGRVATRFPSEGGDPPMVQSSTQYPAKSKWDCEGCRILSIISLFLAFAYCFGLKELVIESLPRLGVPL
jgi:hypothetical protein